MAKRKSVRKGTTKSAGKRKVAKKKAAKKRAVSNPAAGKKALAGLAKPVDKLTPKDLESYPVWEFDLDDETEPGRDETWVIPVAKLPVCNLDNRVIGTTILLSGGRRLPAILGNVDLNDEESNREFRTVSVWHNRNWQRLERPFDADYDEMGPEGFARALGLSVDRVFPMAYDLAPHARGLKEVVQGRVPAAPDAEGESEGEFLSHIVKREDDLTPEDLAAHPVWMENLDCDSEDGLSPAAKYPVGDLMMAIVGTTLVFNNGRRVPGILRNVDLEDLEMTREFLAVHAWHRGKWERLQPPEAHDYDYDTTGAGGLAERLGLTVKQVFPISYDISGAAVGLKSVVKGKIKAGPKK